MGRRPNMGCTGCTQYILTLRFHLRVQAWCTERRRRCPVSPNEVTGELGVLSTPQFSLFEDISGRSMVMSRCHSFETPSGAAPSRSSGRWWLASFCSRAVSSWRRRPAFARLFWSLSMVLARGSAQDVAQASCGLPSA
jgi:hypothetical protein